MKELLYSMNLTELIVAAGLVIALLLSIRYGTSELSTNIASGLIGYIGGNAANKIARHYSDKDNAH